MSVTIWERRGVACSALVACSHHSVKNAEGHKQVPNRQHEASWYETRIDLRPHQIAVVETTLRLVAVPAKVENLLCSAVQARALVALFSRSRSAMIGISGRDLPIPIYAYLYR